MARWIAFPYDAADYRFDLDTLRERWPQLHAGDAEPLPDDERVLHAWARFHAGDFAQAVSAGLHAGAGGITVANKAQAIYAYYLERHEPTRLALLYEVAERAQSQAASAPRLAGAHFLAGYALGRYAQGLSVAAALARGYGTRVKSAFERAIQLEPRHAEAHAGLGSFHAEVIDKVGSLVGRTQGASKDAGLALLTTALRIDPDSIAVRIAYANGLLMLEGEQRLREATALYREASEQRPRDARERLDVEVAKTALRD